MKIAYSVPKKRRIQYEVEAERPVTTFILDDEGLKQYNSGDDVESYYGGFPHRYYHNEKITFPPDFTGPWYLIIQNDDAKYHVAVKYQVFD